jgi:hypothetical protein
MQALHGYDQAGLPAFYYYDVPRKTKFSWRIAGFDGPGTFISGLGTNSWFYPASFSTDYLFKKYPPLFVNFLRELEKSGQFGTSLGGRLPL